MMRNPMVILSLALAASACSYPGGRSAQTETLHYQCGTLPLTVTLDNVHERVNFILDGQQLSLPQVATASGARYSDGQYSFWSKGERAFIERQDKIIVDDCVIQSAAGK
ncbi:Membrane-bound lysozyme inhibitor of c-type lysozyme [Sodalis praecaptivus]|uniref:Membrane-bound lysozyme inhibitor of c-type lysozyme n=1 Tax=Sodalis praecaptivus TaxID=1239307 RepID=W0HY07_9GAMM|nr:MliC family protein [Sodalis praecaptivus]AHF77085.1 Membrane-bound lysozyme inhibitor of c-type lysozyme [Sodalis praecaptivus]OIV46641.1 hypothetical protein BK025_10055 [Sodalis sp. TME1]